MHLRPYQLEAVAGVQQHWADGKTDTLGVAATGAGKTQIFLSIVIDELKRHPERRALIIAHRRELIQQPLERITSIAPDWLAEAFTPRVGIIMAERNEPNCQLTIATVQSLTGRSAKAKEQNRWPRIEALLAHGQIDYLVIDECHHATADTYLVLYQQLKAANPNLKHLGVTATPIRADGDGLSTLYEDVAFKVTIADLVKAHYLVQPRWLAIDTGISLKGVGTSNGDYNAKDLASRFDTPRGREIIVASYQQYAAGRRGIAFTASVQGAHDLAEAFNAAGVAAAAIDANTPKPERAQLVTAFREGRLTILCNVDVLTEGFDAPGASCVLMCRPTKSDGRYIQCLDTQTEVLTDVGWVSHDTAWMAQQVAALDPYTGMVVWRPIEERFNRPLALGEQMYSLQSPTVDLRVTGGHRMLMRHRRSLDPSWRFVTAEKLAQKRSEYQIPVAGVQAAPGVPLSIDELKLLGIWLSDGTMNKANRQVSICQAEHQPQNADIVATLEACKVSYSISRINRASQFNITSPALHYILHRGRENALAHLDPYFDKDLSPLFEAVTSGQLSALLEGLHIGDGIKERNVTWTRRTYHICTSNLTFAERLQSLCVRRGFRCNLASHASPNGSPAYVLHIKYEQNRLVGGANQHDREHLEVSPASSDERVWCLGNELQTLIVRRNGKVAIVGNCMGRGLRPAAGIAAPGEDCIILDFLPEDVRNIVMAGDVLGVPKDQADALRKMLAEREESDEDEELAQIGFTFDGETFDYGGTPLEIVARQLDYLNASRWQWDRRDGWMTLGLGPGADGIERSLAIVTDDEGGHVLHGIARKPIGEDVNGRVKYSGWQRVLCQRGTLDELCALAESKADKYAVQTLAAKGRSWHKGMVSESQINYLRRLVPRDQRKLVHPGLTKVEAANLINYWVIRNALSDKTHG